MAKKKIFKGKVRAKLKKAAKKVGQAAKKVLSKGKDVAFAPVLPFKGVMMKALSKKGIKYNPNSLSEIAALFVHHIVKGHHGFMNENLYFVGGQHRLYVEGMNGDGSHNIVADVALTLVTTIINYLKTLKKKKEEGQALTADEEQVLDMAGEAAAYATQVAGDVAEDTTAGLVKDFIFSWKGGLALFAIILLIIAAVRK